MCNLNSKITEAVACISGNTSYISEVHRAEDIVGLFAEVPKELHLELINSVLLCYMFRDKHVNAKENGVRSNGCAKNISLMLSSEWGKNLHGSMVEALAEVYSSEDMKGSKKMAKIIYSHIKEVPNFICDIIIFAHVFCFLKQHNFKDVS